MITMNVIFTLTFFWSIWSWLSTSPIKMSLVMILMSFSIYNVMILNSGNNFVPMIFVLLIVGGVVLMFMILSSVLPNQKSSKSSTSLKLFILPSMYLISTLGASGKSATSPMTQLKAELSIYGNLMVLMTLILLYFLTFIFILSSEKSALQTSECLEKSNFCKFLKEQAIKMISVTRKEDQILNIMNSSLWDLPSPSSMTYFWNFGSTLGLCLMVQVATGLMLTFHYTSYAQESFSSVISIMREIWGGWIIRFIHMNGASVFFLFIYLHLFRGMFYFSSTHKKVWASGVAIMLILMAISFLGYVLPWGQMSYWAVAVITNLFSVIPLVGDQLVYWIWGGFSVSEPTLTRFYSLHFLLPFILSFMVFTHLVLLHQKGSSNSMGINSSMDKIQFHPYFTIKDSVFLVVVFIVSFTLSFYMPYILGDTVNNVPANAMQTPIHIQPEWYFLPFYAILRAMPSKTTGVIALALSVTIYFILPIYSMKFSTKFSSYRTIMFWMLVVISVYLMKMGALPAEDPYVEMSKAGTMIYFATITLMNL